MGSSNAWNTGGIVVGILLGIFAIIGVVASQTAATGEQYNTVVSYNDPS